VTCVRVACLYCEKYTFKNKNTKERTLSHTPIKSLPSIFLKKKKQLCCLSHTKKNKNNHSFFFKAKNIRAEKAETLSLQDQDNFRNGRT
jgi:hypothetical protein